MAGLPLAAPAQLLLTNASPVTENFDGLESTATAAVPAGVRLSSEAAPTYGSAANYAATTVAAAGNNFTAGGTYNFGAGAGSPDRALGFLNSGSYTSPRHILLAVKNTTGAAVQALNVQFDLEKYRSGSRAFNWTFYTSTDGLTWENQPAGNQSFPADANNTTYSFPPVTTAKQVTLTGLQIPAEATYYLRWSSVGVGGSTNGQGLALDNVVLIPTLSTGPDTPPLSITTTPAAYDSAYCVGPAAGSAPFAVAYTASGTFTGLFKAQLSDAAGVFSANPADNIIGSGPASPITATLPANTPSGRGYRIRVLNDAPLTYGSDNGRDLAISLAPTSNAVTLTPAASQMVTTTGMGTALTATATAPSALAWFYGSSAAGPFTTAIAGAAAATYQVKGTDFPAAGTYYLIAQATSTCGAVTGQSAPVTITVVTSPPADPTLTVSSTSLADFGGIAAGAASGPKSLVVSGTNLTAPVLITPPAGFEIRTGDQPFSCCAIELTPAAGTINSTLIDVRFVPTAAQPYAATLPVSSADVAGQSVAVTGTGVASVYPATVSSTVITALTPTSAAAGGTIDADGGSTVTAQGVVWARTPNPTLSASKTTDGAGPGAFTSALTGLLPGTAYYVRAYATNAVGTVYGEELAFTTGVVPLAAEPTAPATLTAGAVSSTAIQLNLAGGNGAKRLVLARRTGAVDAAPVDATTYPAAAAFGQGSRLGADNFVVYSGADTTVTVTNLQAITTYTFAVFAYNDNDTPYAENYLTTAPGTLTQATPAAPAALLLEENFSYPAGTALTDSNWVAHSGGTTNAIAVVPNGLSYAGYTASGIGNAAALVANGQDVSRTFASVGPRTPVYVSYLVNVANASTAGDYFWHLGPTPLSTNFRSRVFVRKNAATNKVQFGISGSAAATYTTTEYDLTATYLLVIKYSFDETGNLSQLFVNPSGATEPATADASSAEAGSTSPASIGTVALRQGANSPNLVVDGLRVGTTYRVVLTGQVCQAPVLTAPVVPVANATAGLRGASVSFAATATGTSPLTVTYAIAQNDVATAITSSYVFPVGTTLVTATAANDCGTATQVFAVTVQNPTAVSVLHQNADTQVTDNVIRPTLQLVNNGATAIPYAELSVRYWLTVEDFAPITATVDWAELGTRAVTARYVPLAQPARGTLGYVEYRFTATGSLAAGGSSGPIQSRINKQNHTNFNEADDYSYAANRTFLKNERITVYRNGVLIGGAEPASDTAKLRLQAWSQNRAPAPNDNTISTSLEVRNVGNQPVRYADLTARYWFSAEGPAALRAYVDYAQLGNRNVTVTLGQAGTETYAEVGFAATLGELAPLSSTGDVQYRLAKADWSPFNQANDFSYRPAGPLAENGHFTVYHQGQLAYGQEPAGATTSTTANRGTAPIQTLAAPREAPAQAQLVSSYPNPFTGSTTLAFALERSEAYELTIYDANGRLLQRLQAGQGQAGELVRVRWTAAVPPGLYVARLTTATAVQYLKLVRQ